MHRQCTTQQQITIDGVEWDVEIVRGTDGSFDMPSITATFTRADGEGVGKIHRAMGVGGLPPAGVPIPPNIMRNWFERAIG